MSNTPKAAKPTDPIIEATTQEAASEAPAKAEVAPPLPPMSTEMLVQLLVGMQTQMLESQKQQAGTNKALVDAILTSNKPYEDPNRLANEELFKEQAREIEARAKRNERAAQDSCSHIAGSSALSESPDLYGHTSIVWHRGDVGQVYGVCTTCIRVFHQDDPDFAQWRSKRSFNKESRSGDRWVPDPIAAQKTSRLH